MQVNVETPQCRFFVQRKKRLCRMTVRPGKNYCGEHEPEPQKVLGEEDKRILCPLDPKHTCYASKLEKHLQICNAKQGEVPDYIIHNINAPKETSVSPRRPLNQIPKEDLLRLIEKVNYLYEKHIEGNIDPLPGKDIHSVVLPEFKEADRTENSLRHLRQVSRLLQLTEDIGLVQDDTCYVELGAGKGHLSYYVCNAWCSPTPLAAPRSRTLLIDRAALRHKRDNKLKERSSVQRVRADLCDVSVSRVAAAANSHGLVGLAKHLCGVATDYALRCITADDIVNKTRGVVLATCCHHRCENVAYIANKQLLDLGLSSEEFNMMLGIVSWATCGDGKSRDQRNKTQKPSHISQEGTEEIPPELQEPQESGSKDQTSQNSSNEVNEEQNMAEDSRKHLILPQDYREKVGRKAKALIDWGRVLYLRSIGFDARLCHYVPATVSLENVCIVAKKLI